MSRQAAGSATSPAILATVDKLGECRDGDTNVSPVAADTPAGDRSDTGSDTGTTGRRGRVRGWCLLGPLLGLVFLGYPIRAALTTDPTPMRVLFALGGAALFAGGFLWLMWRHDLVLLAPVEYAEVLRRRVAIASLAALVVALNLTLGTGWLVFYFHTSAAAGIVLPRRDAYIAIAGLAVGASAIGIAVGLGFLMLPIGAVGLWATAFAGQVAAVAELKAAREELARLAVAEERLRFARDLHDLLGHSLSLITLKSELAARLLPGAPERAAKEIRGAEAVARRALREVREAVAGYRQPTLGEALAGAREMLDAAGIACRIENAAGLLPPSVEAVLAWAVREGTTNVIRHSRARHCEIRLTRPGGEDAAAVCVEIGDDGRGLSPARDGIETNGGPGSGASGSGGPGTGGSGLSGLAERVAAFTGAAVEAGPLPAGGFRLRVSLPLLTGDPREEERR